MKEREPCIRVAVDPTNPGQFFACCGLLELADRLWGGAEGWFDGGFFLVEGGGTLAEAMNSLLANEPEEVTKLENGLTVEPLIAPLRLSLPQAVDEAQPTGGVEPLVAPLRLALLSGRPNTLTLDAWMTVKIEKGKPTVSSNPPWNFWSGQRTSIQIWRGLRAAAQRQLILIGSQEIEGLFSHCIFFKERFGFDPGPAWNALDVGFSPNEQKMKVPSSAAVELLAAVGIQRFRPKLSDDRQSFVYATWGRPLAPSVAASAACALISVRPSIHFLGRVVGRGSYAALGHSTPIRGETRD